MDDMMNYIGKYPFLVLHLKKGGSQQRTGCKVKGPLEFVLDGTCHRLFLFLSQIPAHYFKSSGFRRSDKLSDLPVLVFPEYGSQALMPLYQPIEGVLQCCRIQLTLKNICSGPVIRNISIAELA